MTAPSNRERHTGCGRLVGERAIGERHRALVGGDHVPPAASALRTCEIAGSPDRMSRVVVSTNTRVSTPWERSCANHSSAEGNDAGPTASPLAISCATRSGVEARAIEHAAVPPRHHAGDHRLDAAGGEIERAISSSNWTNRRATFPYPTSSNAIFNRVLDRHKGVRRAQGRSVDDTPDSAVCDRHSRARAACVGADRAARSLGRRSRRSDRQTRAGSSVGDDCRRVARDHSGRSAAARGRGDDRGAEGVGQGGVAE